MTPFLLPIYSRTRMILSITISLLLAYSFLIEPFWIRITPLSIQTNQNDKKHTIRIAQISDVHIRSLGMREEKVISILKEIKPDLLILTGDMTVTENSLPPLEEFLSQLHMENRTYAILGNWEHYLTVTMEQWRQLYSKYGIMLLINESITLNIGDKKLLITGLDDSVSSKSNLKSALRNIEPSINHLIMIHSPDYYNAINSAISSTNKKIKNGPLFQPTLVTAGHTHGGQVTFFGKSIITPPGSSNYLSGWYGENWPKLYVSRGIGTSLAPIRFFAPPEIPVFEWTLQ